MTTPQRLPRHHLAPQRIGRSRVLLLASLLLACLVPPLALASGPEEKTPAYPTGHARLVMEGRLVSGVPFSLAPAGPLFALEPIARTLGVKMKVGPYGNSHTLFFDGNEVLVGSDMAAMVVVSSDSGRDSEEVVRLDQQPIRTIDGFEVSMDFLERTFGENLGLEFDWRADELRLEVGRRQLRTLEAAVDVVHQFDLSTVVVRLPKVPRFRVERLPGAIEIRMLGDRLQPSRPWRGDDPLVSDIIVLPDRLRIMLAEGASAIEPRLDEGPVARIVIEVVRQNLPQGEVDGGLGVPPGSGDGTLGRPREERGGIRTIVLDPGHGGDETGAIGSSGTAEKDLTLMVARSLRRELERRLPVRVVLTRDRDLELPLDNRTAIANQNRADLFISLHFNSTFGPRAHGAETFFLSREASDQLAAAAAEAENLVDEGQADAEVDLKMILWDLAQSYHLAESQRFANLVQEELNVTLGLRDRGVKQAPFRVLMGANMPAVLVELGFLSNPEEESKLQSPLYRAELVDALVRATSRFKVQIEAREASLAGSAGAATGGQP